jgi:hypothetical protein
VVELNRVPIISNGGPPLTRGWTLQIGIRDLAATTRRLTSFVLGYVLFELPAWFTASVRALSCSWRFVFRTAWALALGSASAFSGRCA